MVDWEEFYEEEKMSWENAIEEAKEDLGHSQYEYIKDWDEVVEKAKEILKAERDNLFDDFSEMMKEEYADYLNGERWKKLRLEILARDGYTCKDCGKPATGVHHLNYAFLETPEEKNYCISICHNCHGIRHHIKRQIK